MREQVTVRLIWVVLASGILTLAIPQYSAAQDDPNDTPLGDVARSFRKKPAPSEVIIDNDNFSKVVEDVESRRVAGSTMVFSLDPGGKGFRVSSPDVSCSLSFSSKAALLLADPVMLDELPRDQLAKLDGPAMIDGDSLQVSMHNGTLWELREVVIGLTIIRSQSSDDARFSYGGARIVPAVAGDSARPELDSTQKQPDVTVLLRVKGSAAPSATALFRTQLNFALFPDQEWHWAIVRAKGVPPPSPSEAIFATQPAAQTGAIPAGTPPPEAVVPLAVGPTPAPTSPSTSSSAQVH